MTLLYIYTLNISSFAR